MVDETMARNYPSLIVALFLFFSPVMQSSPDLACPQLFNLMDTPTQTYPPTTDVCYSAAGSSAHVTTDDSERFPCDQQVNFLFGVVDPSAVSIHLDGYNTADIVRARVQIISEVHIFPDSPPSDRGDDSITVRFYSEDDWGVLLSEQTIFLNDIPEVIGSYTIVDPVIATYSVFFLDLLVPTEVGSIGGFVVFDLNNTNTSFGLASMQGAYYLEPLPDFCPVPNTTNPPTSTPFPSPTVGPGTPTSTPYPTSTWIPTIPIQPTFTPGSFPTIPAENTPTPWPTVILPPVTYPTISIPTPPPLITATPDDGGGGFNFIDPITGAATAWAGIINGPATFSPGANTGLGDTNEVIGMMVAPPTPAGVFSGAEGVQETANTLATIISFVKSVQLYLPRTWPVVYVTLAVMGLIVFTYAARFAARWAVTVLEWLRRLWESIPFLN